MNRPLLSRPSHYGVVLATSALVAGAVAALPATATETGNGVRPGSNIMVMHNIDFVAVGGYGPLGRPVTVRVLRNGVVIGSARGPAIDAEGAPGLEVNHGPEGPARPGDCWDGHTPDIRPGDVIRVTDARGTDQITVDNLLLGDPVEDAGDVVLPVTALRFDGTPFTAAELDSPEFRDGSRLRVNLADDPDAIEVNPIAGSPGQFELRYLAPFDWSRNRDLLDEDQIRGRLLNVPDGHAIGFGHTEPAPPDAQLVEGVGDGSGPAPGCETAPLATEAVSNVTPRVINSRRANRTLRVQGFTSDATEVVVTATGRGGSAETTAVLRGVADRQTFRAFFDSELLAGMQGRIQVTAAVDGRVLDVGQTLIRDTRAPRRPRASLPSGTYRGRQRVALFTGPNNTIRYRMAKGKVAAPRRNKGRIYRGGQLRIRANRTLKMIAIDQAGNVSKVARLRYRIR